MATWSVDIAEMIYYSLDVEADTENEAEAQAKKEINNGFCAPHHTYCEEHEIKATKISD